MSPARIVLDCLSKALVAVAVMLSVAILVGNPPVETPSRTVAATLLAVGMIGLLALRASRPTRR
jgi:hypothetical protein